MTDETDNLILHLLRDIRSKLDDHDRSFDGLQGRMATMERHMEDVKDTVTYALGLSAHSVVAYETSGQRLDRPAEHVSKLEARLENLERSE